MDFRRVVLAASLALSASAHWLAQRQDTAFEVTSPKAGDTVSLAPTDAVNVSVPIAWTVPQALQERPVIIRVVQGDSVATLSTVKTLNSNATNNGTYSWSSTDVESGLLETFYPLSSGCNYSIELKIWTDVAYSGYFTIISPLDGGLNTSATCPTVGIGPGGAVASASTSASSASTNVAASSTSTPTTSAAPVATNSGVSTTTLAVAAAVPVVVLLTLFAFVIWFGRRRGWFTKRSRNPQERQPGFEQLGVGGAGGAVSASDKTAGKIALNEKSAPVEMQGESMPYHSGGQEVYQLPGDEERRI